MGRVMTHSVLLDLTSFKKSTNNDLGLLPPSKEALHQHIYRASYQAGYLWRQTGGNIDIFGGQR